MWVVLSVDGMCRWTGLEVGYDDGCGLCCLLMVCVGRQGLKLGRVTYVASVVCCWYVLVDRA